MLATVLCLGVLVEGIQNQFILPPSLRYPLYDIQFQDEPIHGINDYSPSSIVSVNYGGQPIKCLIPDPDTETKNHDMFPLNDKNTISEARSAISDLHYMKFVSVDDDVWAWYLDFNSSIVQFLPTQKEEPGSLELYMLPNSFQVSVGSPGNADGTNLQTAQPVVVDDRNMLMTTFHNGSRCDLTGSPRTSHIFFTCDPDSVSKPTLLSVNEPYSCTYEFTVGYSKLCSIPEFNGSKANPNILLCGPDPKFYESSASENDKFDNNDLIMDGIYGDAEDPQEVRAPQDTEEFQDTQDTQDIQAHHEQDQEDARGVQDGQDSHNSQDQDTHDEETHFEGHVETIWDPVDRNFADSVAENDPENNSAEHISHDVNEL